MNTGFTGLPLSSLGRGAEPSKIYGSPGLGNEPGQFGFSSELEAVVAASNRYNPISIQQDREFIGAILQIEQHYFYTAEPGTPGKDKVALRLIIPAGTVITSFWHTHGNAGREREYFSETDSDLVESMNKPFYLADYTGRLKVLLPGDKTLVSGLKYRDGLLSRKLLIPGREVTDATGNFITVKIDS